MGKRKPKVRLRGKHDDLLARWEGGLEEIQTLKSAAVGSKDQAPDAAPEAILKVGIYRLMNELLATYGGADLETVLAHKMESAPRMSFELNPYYWALKAAAKDGELDIDPHRISRYAAEMRYARRHQLPAELLVGFLHQVGAKNIATKLREGVLESWYPPTPTWLPSPEASIMRARKQRSNKGRPA